MEDLIQRFTQLQGQLNLPLKSAPCSSALICFTSGTTGSAKGAVLSHSTLNFQSLAKIASVGYNQNDVYLHAAPLFHIGGISSALAVLMAGGRHIFLPRFEAGQIISAVDRHRVTAMIAVPTMLADLITAARRGSGPRELPSVRLLLIGGGIMAPQLERGVTLLFPAASIVLAYGMTEGASSVTFHLVRRGSAPLGGWLTPDSHPGTPLEKTCAAPPGEDTRQALVGGAICVGRAAPHIELTIDSESLGAPRNSCGDVEGEVLTRGPHLMRGYWGQEAETRGVLTQQGWLKTGDVGWLDSKGRLWLRGRKKDVVKSGGENVHAAEVEGVIVQHPGVVACAVVGVPDERLGEAVAALVVVRDEGVTPEGLRVFCRDLGLSRFKVPKVFQLQRSPLPVTALGKVRKDEVRRVVLEALDSSYRRSAVRSCL